VTMTKSSRCWRWRALSRTRPDWWITALALDRCSCRFCAFRSKLWL